MHERTVRVTIDSGTIEGFTRDGVHRWRAIPYARPPVGPLRFRAPQPVQPWSGVRPCHGFRYCAPQRKVYTALGPGRFQPMSEDCLTLNVTAPEWTPERALPVLVFIHGGGYILGSSATPIYDGASLARHGCVFVSVNYRLGALGCLDLSSLSTPEVTIEDNLFLRDLVAALRWVRTNISVFGGDPDNVTIFGESAGAHAVATLLAVPAAAGLFHRAISESPAAGLAGDPQTAAQYAKRFAALLGADESSAAEALLAARPADLVVAVEQLIKQGEQDMLGAFAVGPTYDTEYLPVEPVQAMRTGRAHPVPLIVGSNAEEGRLFTRFLKLLPMNQPAIERLLARVDPQVRQRILAAYPDYPRPEACVRLGGDFAFASAVWQIAEAHSAHQPTYVYRYDFAPRALHLAGLGATHAIELFAVFDVYRTGFGRLLTAAGDRRAALRVSDEVQARWREFARSGQPGRDWPRYSADQRAVLVFDRRPRVEHDPNAERRAAWADFTLV